MRDGGQAVLREWPPRIGAVEGRRSVSRTISTRPALIHHAVAAPRHGVGGVLDELEQRPIGVSTDADGLLVVRVLGDEVRIRP